MGTMTLDRYYRALTAEEKRQFARKARSTPIYLSHIIAGRKRPGIEKCVDIERASGGVVRGETLNPSLPWRYLAKRGR